MEQTNGTQRTRLPLYGDAANGNTKRQLDDVDIEAELRAFEEAERERLGIKASRRQWADTMLTPDMKKSEREKVTLLGSAASNRMVSDALRALDGMGARPELLSIRQEGATIRFEIALAPSTLTRG